MLARPPQAWGVLGSDCIYPHLKMSQASSQKLGMDRSVWGLNAFIAHTGNNQETESQTSDVFPCHSE